MKIIILAFIGALIGYITNVLAVKLLFRPIKPTRYFKIQGLIPKRHNEIAKSIANTIESELLSIEDIVDKVVSEVHRKKVLDAVKLRVIELMQKKFAMYAMFGSIVDDMVEKIFEEEGEKILDEIILNSKNKLSNSISIKGMVEEKILSLDLIKLETIIIEIAHKELKHIEILGGVLGLIIGFVQGLIITVI